MTLNYDDAILAHSRWKKRLSALIEGTSTEVFDPDKVDRDDQCDLGKWIQTVPFEVRQDPEFALLVAEHSGFHKHAAAIIRLAQKGNLLLARQGIGPASDYMRKSTAVINLIGRMRDRIK